MRAPRGARTLGGMQQSTEFRYRDHTARDHAAWLLFIGMLLVFGSFITGAWGIAALVHASWLHTNDLFTGTATAWGIVLLSVATVQGISGLLVVFDRPSGSYLGIAITVIGIAAHLLVIGVYTLWSIAAILVDLAVIAVLWSYRRRS
jgi:hypothetical protein